MAISEQLISRETSFKRISSVYDNLRVPVQRVFINGDENIRAGRKLIVLDDKATISIDRGEGGGIFWVDVNESYKFPLLPDGVPSIKLQRPVFSLGIGDARTELFGPEQMEVAIGIQNQEETGNVLLDWIVGSIIKSKLSDSPLNLNLFSLGKNPKS